MKGCIVGLGSIGARHLKNLEFLGVNDLVVLRRTNNPAYTTAHPVVSSHAEALAAKPDFAVICSPTSMHISDALPFLQAGVPTLIEKPLAASLDHAPHLPGPGFAAVAYSLRYHPAYARAWYNITQCLLGRLIYAKIWNESYLPDWHPGEDWRQSYAARRDLGGGLPHTLDHEIDFALWCQPAGRGTAGEGWRKWKLGVDDVSFLRVGCASITLSMCRRQRSRGFEFVTDSSVLSFDWESGLLRFHDAGSPDAQVIEDHCKYDTNQMYVDMMRDFLNVVEGRPSRIPDDYDGRQSLRVIEEAYHA